MFIDDLKITLFSRSSGVLKQDLTCQGCQYFGKQKATKKQRAAVQASAGAQRYLGILGACPQESLKFRVAEIPFPVFSRGTAERQSLSKNLIKADL